MGVAGWRGGTTDLCPGDKNPGAATAFKCHRVVKTVIIYMLRSYETPHLPHQSLAL